MQWNFSIDRDLGHQTGLRLSYIAMQTRDLAWSPDLNQSQYSTTYYVAQPLSRRPFPNWGTINARASGANAKYQSGQIEVNHRTRGGITFNSTYTFAKNLANNQGYTADHFADENSGHRTMDRYDLGHEYGDVYGSRRHRWITTGIYDLPVGRARKFGSNMNRVVDAVIGGWQLSSIFLWQSGPYLTPYFNGGDPSGTGSGVIGRSQAPDLVGGPNLSNPNRNDWFNLSSFVCPATPGWAAGHSMPDRFRTRICTTHRSLRQCRHEHRPRTRHYQPERRPGEVLRHHGASPNQVGGIVYERHEPRQSRRPGTRD